MRRPSASGSVKSGAAAPMASAAFAFGVSEAFVAHAAVEANASASRSAIAESFFITLSSDSFRESQGSGASCLTEGRGSSG